MALYDPGPLLAFIASFISLVGNFFAILFATYDTDAFWTERYLSGNTQDYYWHIFCWSLDEYDRARAFCWIFAIGVVVVLYFTVGSCRGSGRHAVERRARESRFEERSKAYEAEIKGLKEQVATHDGATEALKNRIDVLENDLTGAEEKISDLKKDLTGAKDKILNLGKELEASEKATKTALHDFDYQKDLVETRRRDLENQKTELENQRKQFGDQKEQLKSKETKLEAQPKATTTQKDLVNKLRGEKIRGRQNSHGTLQQPKPNAARSERRIEGRGREWKES
jgi:chromosome segregation ATPase